MRFHESLAYTWEDLASRKLLPVDVAIIDSGVDATHPALRRRVKAAWTVRPDGGRQAIVRRRVPSQGDGYGHGTGVAGIIARLAPNARLIDIRILDESNTSSGETLLAGFALAVKLKSRIINLSLACKASFAAPLHELCEAAYRQNLLVVAAKRNMPLVDNGFPAELSACVSVDMADFASPYILRFRKKPPIEFVAQGEAVRTTASGGGYADMTGTSFATPTVSGLCALILGAYPDLRPFEMKSLLKAFAESATEDGVRKRTARRGPRTRQARAKKTFA